jgi:hypothetical protein
MVECDGPAADQAVRHSSMVKADLDQAIEKGDSKLEAADRRRQARLESQRVAVVAHASETVYKRQPSARQ